MGLLRTMRRASEKANRKKIVKTLRAIKRTVEMVSAQAARLQVELCAASAVGDAEKCSQTLLKIAELDKAMSDLRESVDPYIDALRAYGLGDLIGDVDAGKVKAFLESEGVA